jgi:hypothetical protein
MSKIKDTIDVNKKPIHDRINKYKEHKYKEKTAINKQNMMALSTVQSRGLEPLAIPNAPFVLE